MCINVDYSVGNSMDCSVDLCVGQSVACGLGRRVLIRWS